LQNEIGSLLMLFAFGRKADITIQVQAGSIAE
jgi:hypothetical protein